MSSSARSFGTLSHYLVSGRSHSEPERIAWSTSRHLPTDDPELAGKIMRATAAQNVRVKQPVYHLALSFDPHDAVDRAAMERVADRVLDALNLQGHQVLIVSHNDRTHPHMHLMINRVHPETGHVWNRWHDRAVIQQVLREEEHALGLRVVPGRLTSEQARAGDPAFASMRELPRADIDIQPHAQAEQGLRIAPPRLSRVVEVATDLQAYERISELTQKRYRVEIDASDARARLTQLEQMTQRAAQAQAAFERALNQVYREPQIANDRFSTAAAQAGIADATRVMREQPERYGELVITEQTGTLGRRRSSSDLYARTAAMVAAGAGRAAWEANNAWAAEVAPERAGRSDDNLSRAFAAVYDNPVRARAAYAQLVAARGVAEVERRVRAHPETVGTVQAAVRSDPPLLAARIDELLKIGTARENVPGARGVDSNPSSDIPREVALARAAVAQIVSGEARIRAELAAIPDRTILERRIGDLLQRLTPHEVRRLQSLVTTPQLAIVSRIRSAVRDAFLGREDTAER